jgi:VWFA-related protein
MRLLRLAVLGAMLAAVGSVGHGQQVPPPRFTAGVDLVQIDVSVLDRHGAPVTGLSADDFVVLENGKPQQIRGFASIAVPPPIALPAAWLRDIGPDVVSNAAETRRFVVILMDDAFTGFEEGEAKLAKAVARAAVERLGPADLAAVVFTFLGRAQNFTADRRELDAAIESFSPRGGASPGPPLACTLQRGGCVVASLQNIGNVLAEAPPGRKLLIYVGSAPDINFKGDGDDPVSVVTDMFRSLQRANVEVNAFDVAGLRTFAGKASDRTVKDMNDRVSLSRAAQDNLRTLADNTGGRAVVNTNAPEAAIADVFRRNSVYYLVGFQSSDTRSDGRYRRIEVKVNRPDVEVRTRSGYYAARPADSRKGPDAAPLDAALAHGLPLPDLPLQLHASVVPAPGRREAWVIVTSGLLQSADFAAEHVTVLTAAFDTGATERARHRQSFDLPARAAASGTWQYDVHARFLLRPGRYEIRVAAESRDRRGTVMKSVDVPDFAAAPLSQSSVLIERTPAIAIQMDATREIAPIVPTSARVFRRAERVSLFVRVSQGGKTPLSRVSMTTRIVNARDAIAFEQRDDLSDERFAAGRAGDYRLDLPLGRLEPGDYLLQVDAIAGERTSSRDARFTVR